MRAQVHNTYKFEVLYFEAGSMVGVPCTVRLNRNDQQYGNYDGIGYANQRTEEFVITFDHSDSLVYETVSRGAVIELVEACERYHIEYVDRASDGQTKTYASIIL
jgi:DNA-dependent RNA polymerase auxiliary subunit epsilon